MKYRTNVSALLFFMCGLLTLWAPKLSAQDVGIIQGQVIDGATGEFLRAATVQVVGTTRGAYSDVKGTYTIKKVPVGTYSIRASYTGYAAQIIEGITVKSGQTTKLNITLKPDIKMMDEIVVTARRSDDNQASLLAQRKNSAQVSDGISIEEIKRTPDSDAGQALRRVSGVTLMNDKFIQVRGVGERYSNTTLNGASLSTTEPDKKSFAFDIFPADLLQNATIAKSFTPDLPGNFAGGLVQLNTVEFPDGPTLSLSLSSSFNSNVTLKSDAFQTYPGGGTDWLGFDDGSREMPSEIPDSRRDMDALRRAANDPFDTTGAKEQWVAMGKNFHNNLWKRESTTAMPNGSFSLSAGDVYSVLDNDFGIIGSLTYSNSYASNTIERNSILADKSPLYKMAGTQSARSVNWGGLLNLAYKIGEHSSVSIKNTYNRSSDDEVVSLEGQDLGYQFVDLKLYGSQFVQKELFATQVGGEHTIAAIANTLFDWKVGYSQSERDEPDFRRLRYSRLTADSSLPYEAEIPLTPQGNGVSAGRFFSNLQEEATNVAANIAVPFMAAAKVKFGGLVENRNRVFSARSLTYVQANGGAVDVDFTSAPDSLFTLGNFREDGLGISEDTRMSDSYDAEEHLQAAYAMIDVPFQIAEENFRFIGGARFEHSRQQLNSFAIDDSPVAVDLETNDVLPSINLIYQMNDKANVRASASQTLARPSLREFAPFAFYDFQSQVLIQGNPNLKRSLIQNYDLRFELFPNPGEVLSASLFYKTFKDAIEETIFPQQSELTRTFDNADGTALTYGLEFEVRKSLAFLGEYATNFLLNVNYAIINSEVSISQGGDGATDKRQMWGQSPYTLNVGVYFVEPELRTSINLSYNIYGRRIVQVAQQGVFEFSDPHVYELPRGVVDLSIAQPISDMFQVRLSIRDLLNAPIEWEQGGVKTYSTLRGRSVGLSFGYKLQ